jgi:protein-S-isoprenylcysteine O-methyltransferase Ste14
MSYLLAISLAFLASELGLLFFKHSRSGSSAGNSGRVQKDKNSLRMLWLVIGSSMTLGVFAALVFFPKVQFISLGWIPLVVVGAGFLLRWIAIFQLREAFTVDVAISKTHQLKQDGLYRLVRHPSYTGLLLIFLGISLLLHNWTSMFLVNVPVIIALLYRIRIEEEALCEAFGQLYREYMQKTKRLIPFLY